MMMEQVVFVAGLLHFCQVPGIMIVHRKLGWQNDLAKLSPINARIVSVMSGGILLTVLGTGIVVMTAAAEIAAGTRLGLAFAGFLALFWAYRGAVQVCLYARIWPRGAWGRMSHYMLVALFTFLTGVYLLAVTFGVWQGRLQLTQALTTTFGLL